MYTVTVLYSVQPTEPLLYVVQLPVTTVCSTGMVIGFFRQMRKLGMLRYDRNAPKFLLYKKWKFNSVFVFSWHISHLYFLYTKLSKHNLFNVPISKLLTPPFKPLLGINLLFLKFYHLTFLPIRYCPCIIFSWEFNRYHFIICTLYCYEIQS